MRRALPAALAQLAAEGLDPDQPAGFKQLVRIVAVADGVATPRNGVALCEPCAAEADKGVIDPEELRRRRGMAAGSRPPGAKATNRDRGADIVARSLDRQQPPRTPRAALTLSDMRSGQVVESLDLEDSVTCQPLLLAVERESTGPGQVMATALRPQKGVTKCLSLRPDRLMLRDASHALPRLYRSRPSGWARIIAHLRNYESAQHRSDAA